MTRNPIVQGAAAVVDTGSSNVANNAYTQILTAANNNGPCVEIQVANGGSQPLQLAKGGAGSEVDTGVIIHPGLSARVPIEIPAGTRLALKSLGSTQSSGVVSIMFLA